MYFIVWNIVLCITLVSVDVYAAQLSKVKIGMNLSGITDHASQWVFTNALWSSRPWTGEMNDVKGYYHDGLKVDNNGWLKSLKPGETAFSLVFVDIGGKYPKGKYLLTYNGEGWLQFKWKILAHRRDNGSYVLDVLPDDAGIEIRITQTNPHNPIRNMRLMMPGYWEQNESNLYHPNFLKKMKKFFIYRFMDWQETNNSTISSWEDRPKITDATFAGGKGVPLEFLVLLCNIQNASPWFNIPHSANEDYIRRFAEYVQQNLNPSLDIYIEYSNEVWNTIFEQHRFAVKMGRKMGLSSNDFQAYARFYSQRSVEIFKIWKDVFKNDSRLKFILAGQMGNDWLAREILNWRGAHMIASAYAIAPYFGGKFGTSENAKKAKEMEVAEFEAALYDDIKDVAVQVGQLHKLLRQYGIPIYAYEAGQHLVGISGNENDPSLNHTFDKINRDSAMRRLYSFYLESWKDNGGDAMMVFSSIAKQSKWGRWGMAEDMYMERGESPKLDAILDFMEKE